jgi:hypothetical protein
VEGLLLVQVDFALLRPYPTFSRGLSNFDCLSSMALYRALVERGYRYVRRYAGGLLDWEGEGLALERAAV